MSFRKSQHFHYFLLPELIYLHLFAISFLSCVFVCCFSGTFGGFGATTTTAAAPGSTFSFAAPANTTGQ